MTAQLDLTLPDPATRFDGATIQPEDCQRLTGQLLRTYELLSDGEWWTIRELADCVECSDQSASARIRDLRKAKFGGFNIERRRWNANDLACGYREGTHFYRMVLP